ncbi:MAG: tetratricopeptide repeat protein, partial [Planctomycetaceae bacterium]|nr:tetratricopeptide repeat protein [Planctomycetaceae bacterium]
MQLGIWVLAAVILILDTADAGSCQSRKRTLSTTTTARKTSNAPTTAKPVFRHDFRKGDQVIVKTAAKLAVKGKGTVGSVTPGQVLNVAAVNDRWLWVKTSPPGWLDAEDVTSLRQHVQNLTRRGLQELANRQFTAAAATFTDILKLDPDDTGAMMSRGEAQLGLQHDGAALTDFESVLSFNPRHASALGGRAKVLAHRGEHDAAIVELSLALRLAVRSSEKADLHQERSDVWLAKRDFAAAAADREMAARLEPQNAYRWNS